MEDWKHCPEFAPLADLIRNYDSFAVVAHIHPDGDAIGSTLALGNALKNMGKHVVMMNEDGVPASLAFLLGVCVTVLCFRSRWMWKWPFPWITAP